MSWIIFTFASGIILELCIGRSGILLPVVSLLGFYFTVTFSWKKSIFPYLFATAFVDMAFGRSMPLTMSAIPFVMLLAYFWRMHGNTQERILQFFPGLMIGVNTALLSLLYILLHSLATDCPLNVFPLALIIKVIGLSGVAFPFISLLCDFLAHAMGYKRFAMADHYRNSIDNEHDGWEEI